MRQPGVKVNDEQLIQHGGQNHGLDMMVAALVLESTAQLAAQEPLDLSGVLLRPIDLLEHVPATGSTGSGKTRSFSFLMPTVEQVLRRFGSNFADKAGMFLMDAKGDMSELAVECARRAGREE